MSTVSAPVPDDDAEGVGDGLSGAPLLLPLADAVRGAAVAARLPLAVADTGGDGAGEPLPETELVPAGEPEPEGDSTGLEDGVPDDVPVGVKECDAEVVGVTEGLAPGDRDGVGDPVVDGVSVGDPLVVAVPEGVSVTLGVGEGDADPDAVLEGDSVVDGVMDGVGLKVGDTEGVTEMVGVTLRVRDGEAHLACWGMSSSPMGPSSREPG